MYIAAFWIITRGEEQHVIIFLTLGFQFWKQNSRKFYAVPEVDLSHAGGSGSRKRKRSIENEDVDEKLDGIIEE